MRLLYVVQRYGPGVVGGAESACRMLAEHMASRGHVVEVLTSCAREYTTWADEFEAGTSELGGVTVHRLPVSSPRSAEEFNALSARVLSPAEPASLAVERDWVRAQGPQLDRLEAWLETNSGRFDVAVFMTYLYSPSASGLPIAARHTATVLHPAAHDEPMLNLRPYDSAFRRADGIALFTPEEGRSVERRTGQVTNMAEIGLGIDVDPPPADGSRFRDRFGLGESPVLLYVGRIEPAKGTDELFRYFVHSAERLHHEVKLVLVGPVLAGEYEHPAVVSTGFVDDQTRLDAYAAASWFVLPSYFESFSLSLCEAWVVRRAALVNSNCAVLRGQAARSGAALGYRDYAEFEAALLRLIGDPQLSLEMGERGRRYVLDNYDWPVVIRRYERLLGSAAQRHRDRSHAALEGLSPCLAGMAG